MARTLRQSTSQRLIPGVLVSMAGSAPNKGLSVSVAEALRIAEVLRHRPGAQLGFATRIGC